MAHTNPEVPPQFEEDLPTNGNIVIHHVDDGKLCRTVTYGCRAYVVLRPYLVVVEDTGTGYEYEEAVVADIPLERVVSVESFVDDQHPTTTRWFRDQHGNLLRLAE